MAEETVVIREEWEWFCGVNSTDIVGSNWDSHMVSNTCQVDLFVTVVQMVSVAVFSTVLLLLKCTRQKTISTRYLVRYPGHSWKWLVTFMLALVLMASVIEGIITDSSYPSYEYGTQSHFYVTPGVSLLGLAISIVFYHMMEVWGVPHMSLSLVVYWIVSLAADSAQMSNLLYQEEDILSDGQTLTDIMKYDLVLCRLIFYSFLLLLELNVVRAKVSYK